MDPISISLANRQSIRIKKFIANPDSNSGIITTPAKIEAGQSITIKSGRQAVLPDIEVVGELIIEDGGEVFIPSGGSYNQVNVVCDNIKSVDNSVVINTKEIMTSTSVQDVSGKKNFTSGIVSDTIMSQGQYVSPYSGMKNLLINGNFIIDQYARGTVVNPTGIIYTDRWWVANSASVSRVAQTNDIGYAYGLSVSKTAGQDTEIFQRVEIVKDKARSIFNGKILTYSFDVWSDVTDFIEDVYFNKNGVTVNSYEVKQFSIDKNTIAGTKVRVSGKLLVNFTYQAGDYIEFRIDPKNGVAGTVIISNVQLEEGSVPTPFENRPMGLELALCQRYYQSYLSQDTIQLERTFYSRFTSNTNQTFLFDNIQFPMMRVLPTITLSCLNGSTTRVNGVSNNGVIENDWVVYCRVPFSFSIYKVLTPVINAVIAFDCTLDAEL